MIRQEYVNHGILVPTELQPVQASTHFTAGELNNTAYSLVSGQPGPFAESIRTQYNSLLNSDEQIVPFRTGHLSATAVVVKATSTIQTIGTILHTVPCNGVQPCDDQIVGTTIVAGNNGIADTEAFRGDFGLQVTSAWRNPERNEAVGGVLTSMHQYAGAIDMLPLNVTNHTRAQLMCILQTARDNTGGNGFAEDNPASPVMCNTTGVSHIHIQQ